MKNLIVLLTSFIFLGSFSLYSMEQPELFEQKEQKNLFSIGILNNETGRSIKDIEIISKGDFLQNIPDKKIIIDVLKKDQTMPVHMGYLHMHTSSLGIMNSYFSINADDINILNGQLSIYPPQFAPLSGNVSIVLVNASGDIISKSFMTIDLTKKIEGQIDIILRDGPNGEPFEGSEVELHAMQ